MSTFAKDITESVVVELREINKYRIDWHFYRNRILVKTLDPVDEVKKAWWKAVKERGLDQPWVAGVTVVKPSA